MKGTTVPENPCVVRAKKSLLRLLIAASFIAQAFAVQPRVKPGIDVLRDRHFDILQGKRVGLVTNPTGVTADLEATIDVLAKAPGVQLVALYGPEHGVRGDNDAGKYVESYLDKSTGLPVYSLYGKTRKPTKDMLHGIDVLVYDIQDIGLRSYTYISTMGLVMEAAAENKIPFVVLDRPDPLTGIRVEGPMLEPKYKSFVGAYPIPYVYGMTAGELAEMINGERWLADSVQCNLTVVPLEGWKRTMWWDETGLSWVPSSPNIPHACTIMFAAMTGPLGELGTVNQGVGYTLPFELVGAPWANGAALAKYLNEKGLSGIHFRPLSYRPATADTVSIRYEGVQLHVLDKDRVNFTQVEFSILEALLHVFPEYNIFARAKPDRLEMFDKVEGTFEIRRQLMNGVSVDDLLSTINQSRSLFMIKREKYLLYN
jgi:uncharacterized protein YbbC (DUF1343 family)